MSDTVYCWHFVRGFFYYCSEHKPNKPDKEITVLAPLEILAPVCCVTCDKQLKPEQRASADPGLRDLDLSELGISPEQAASFDRIIVEQDTIAREESGWLDAERRS